MKNKTLVTLTLLFGSTQVVSQASVEADHSFQQTRFEKIKVAIFETPYETLPNYKVLRKQFGQPGNHEQNKLLQAARRTFDDASDLITLPTGQKLLNANGICFAGQWKITKHTPFTGLYQYGSEVPAIVRASVALSGTEQRHKRAFGMAIKLLPHDLGNAPSLNAFVLHSMGGTKTKHVLDLTMDNAPPLGRLPNFRDLSTALRLRSDLEKADKEKGAKKPNVSFRPVTSFAHYKLAEKSVIAPKWLRLSPLTNARVDQNDFRNELNVQGYPEQKIRYSIDVAPDSKTGKKSKAVWQTIGELTLSESISSLTCDTQLHFQHPKLKTPD